MVIKKYSNEKSIRNKIHQLFDYRKISELLLRSGLDKNKSFTGQLTDIQYRIYLLDAYLEGQWELNKPERKSYWESMTLALSNLNYSEKEIYSLLEEVRDYERIEINCRKNKWPDRVPFRQFYTTKSCDVRLIRHLIYDAYPGLQAIWKEAAWIYYDRITEINDDLSDVPEDLKTYNCNRFLISILRKGSKKTTRQYRDYLIKVTDQANAYFKAHPHKGEHEILNEWTSLRSKETIQLLEHMIETTDPELYSDAILLEHMK